MRLSALGVAYLTASIGSYAISNALMYLDNRSFSFGLAISLLIVTPVAFVRDKRRTRQLDPG